MIYVSVVMIMLIKLSSSVKIIVINVRVVIMSTKFNNNYLKSLNRNLEFMIFLNKFMLK